jgi:hypothetical protein
VTNVCFARAESLSEKHIQTTISYVLVLTFRLKTPVRLTALSRGNHVSGPGAIIQGILLPAADPIDGKTVELFHPLGIEIFYGVAVSTNSASATTLGIDSVSLQNGQVIRNQPSRVRLSPGLELGSEPAPLNF